MKSRSITTSKVRSDAHNVNVYSDEITILILSDYDLRPIPNSHCCSFSSSSSSKPFIMTKKAFDDEKKNTLGLIRRNHVCQNQAYTKENVFEDENVKITNFEEMNCSDGLIVYMVSLKRSRRRH